MASLIHQLIAREDDEAKCKANPNLCEKPAISSNVTWIVIGALGGTLILAIGITLIVFHVRRQRSDAREWTKDPQELEDYGIDAAALQANRNKYSNHNAASAQSLAKDLREQQNPFGSNAEVISDGQRGGGYSNRA